MSGERTTFFIISRKMKTQKIFTFFWASLAAAFFTGADAGTVVNGFADRGNFTAMDSSLVKSPEGGGEKIFVNSLKLKAGETKRVFSTRSGLLKAGKKYTAKLRYKMRSPDPAALANLKLHAPGAQRHLGASVGESFVKMPFEVPANNAKASVTLNVTGPVEASISSFEIEDGDGESFISAKSNGGEFKGNLEKLPTGSPEFSVELPKDGGITVNAADYGMNEQNEDCATTLNKAIAACREKKASKLIIPKGTYKFFGKTPITVKNFTDFTIDGNGSTFIYRRDGGSANMMVIDCLRTEVRNLSMDWDWQTEPLAAIVKAVGAKSDGNNSYADFEILEYDKYPLYGKNVRIANFQPWDGKARMIGIENVNGIGFGFQPNEKGPKVEWLSPNKIRVFSKHCEYCARNQQEECARIGRLLADGAATGKQADDARARLNVLRGQLDALLSTLGKNRSSISENASALQYEREEVEEQLRKSRITAPLTGTVLLKYAEAGEYATPGRPLFKMADLDNVYFRCYFTASQLAHLRLGQEVTVIADFGGDEQYEYPGRVTWIAQESEFTPKAIQTRDSRANLVYAVKVAVKNDGRLKLGQYGEVRL